MTPQARLAHAIVRLRSARQSAGGPRCRLEMARSKDRVLVAFTDNRGVQMGRLLELQNDVILPLR